MHQLSGDVVSSKAVDIAMKSIGPHRALLGIEANEVNDTLPLGGRWSGYSQSGLACAEKFLQSWQSQILSAGNEGSLDVGKMAKRDLFGGSYRLVLRK